MRVSLYKEQILDLLKSSHLLSMTEINQQISGADFSTIFRNVEQLCAEGLVRKVVVAKDVILYEIAEKNHRHDHFVCTDCGTIESIQLPKKIIGKSKVSDVLVRGVCEECDK